MRLGNSYMLWFYYSNEIIFQPSNLPNYNIQDTVSYRCATCIYCNVWRTLLNVGELCLADEIPPLQFMNVPNFGCPIIWKGGKDSAVLEHSDSGKKEIRKRVMTIESKQWALIWRLMLVDTKGKGRGRERKKDGGRCEQRKEWRIVRREVVTNLLMDSLCSWMCTIIWPFGVHLDKYHRGKHHQHTACKMSPIALC